MPKSLLHIKYQNTAIFVKTKHKIIFKLLPRSHFPVSISWKKNQLDTLRYCCAKKCSLCFNGVGALIWRFVHHGRRLNIGLNICIYLRSTYDMMHHDERTVSTWHVTGTLSNIGHAPSSCCWFGSINGQSNLSSPNCIQKKNGYAHCTKCGLKNQKHLQKLNQMSSGMISAILQNQRCKSKIWNQ